MEAMYVSRFSDTAAAAARLKAAIGPRHVSLAPGGSEPSPRCPDLPRPSPRRHPLPWTPPPAARLSEAPCTALRNERWAVI